MAAIKLPGIPDVAGLTVQSDPMLRELLLALKITVEKLTGATPAELDELLTENE
jgi:hypothetical protein